MSKEPSYIRCIKPNDFKKAGKSCKLLVLNLLVYYVTSLHVDLIYYFDAHRRLRFGNCWSSSEVFGTDGKSSRPQSWICLSKTI